MKHSRQCFIAFPNTAKFVKNTPLRVVFSTLFSVFGNKVKHGLSCLIYYLNDVLNFVNVFTKFNNFTFGLVSATVEI